MRAGLIAIVCVGETRQQREAGKTLAVVKGQINAARSRLARGANLIVAYEPVWAIGTGLTPTAADVAEVHAMIRAELSRLVGARAWRRCSDPLWRFGEAVQRRREF